MIKQIADVTSTSESSSDIAADFHGDNESAHAIIYFEAKSSPWPAQKRKQKSRTCGVPYCTVAQETIGTAMQAGMSHMSDALWRTPRGGHTSRAVKNQWQRMKTFC